MPNARCVYKDEGDFQCVSFVEHRLLRMCQYHANLALPQLATAKEPQTSNDTPAPPTSNLSKRHGVVVSNWRTTMCDNFTLTGKCPYGYTCAFAHGKSKLRNPGDPFPKVVYVPKSGVGENSPDASDDDEEKHEEQKYNHITNPPNKPQTMFAPGSPFLYFVPKKPISLPSSPPPAPPRPPSVEEEEEEYDIVHCHETEEEEEIYTCPKIVDKDMLRDLRLLRKIQQETRRPSSSWW